MIEYKFILNPASDNLEIEHPVGFNDTEISIKRDEKYHGIGFEASTTSLGFHGSVAVDFLREQKELYGLKANVTFQGLARCEGEEDYEEVISGKLNFGKWKESCGKECIINLPIEEDSCIVTLKSRWEHKIDFDSYKAFDAVTSLPNYNNLGIEIELPPVAIEVGIDASVAGEGDYTEVSLVDRGEHAAFFRPQYSVIRQNSIKTGNLDGSTNFAFDSVLGDPYGYIISPQLLFEDNKGCFNEPINYTIRLKGSAVIHKSGDNFDLLASKVILSRINNDFVDTEDTRIDSVDISMPLIGTEFTGTFDHTFFGFFTDLREGDGIYAFLRFDVEDPTPTLDTFSIQYDITFDKETSVSITTRKICPATNTDAYLVHETLSHGAEMISDMCMRVKSSYYGRTDSQPFSFDTDGCGGLRMLTSGLKIRRANEDRFFASMKDLIEGLTNIDNTGWGIEPDPDRPGKFLLRIEDLSHFYRDEEILRCEAIPEGSIETEESRHYSKINVGYKKWEVEDVNGLDEINSTREYRTSLTSVSNTLDVTSDLVSGSYPIELTRQQSFANTGGSDYKYDNDTFVISLIKNAYGFQVEHGNVTDSDNMYSPETIYNYRISPIRNLMRWYRSIANSYPNTSDADNKLFFNSGTGNFIAEGEMTSEFCKSENSVIAENQHLFVTHFADQSDALPLWKNETIAYEYPLSVADYKRIKLNPYGYISFQCGEWYKGYIKEIKYKIHSGVATFILRKKWQS